MPFIKREKAEWLASHAAELWEYDETSPSCLRWKIDVAKNIPKGSEAGNLWLKAKYRVRASGKQYFAHHIVWTLHFGLIPPEREIDHIDINSTNNRIANLRLVGHSENNKNRRVMGAIKYKGVCRYRLKYQAQLQANGKRGHIGFFNTPEEAARAWDREAAKQGRTDLNFPDLLD